LKKILIVCPHFPPSNLAAVHRSRLFAYHLPSFGWEPIILAVHEKYYEEALDYNLEKLLPSTLRIEKVEAFTITKPRIIGDIGLRAFFQLYTRAKKLIVSEKIDFLYIPIPSFYCALLGRLLYKFTKIKYGIDYIDPWVHYFPGSNKKFSRHWFSTQIAKLLEPIAIKRASLITGVAEGYYQGVIERNPHLVEQALFGAMPYGGELNDHIAVNYFDINPYLFKKKPGKIQIVYAGAMLPKAYQPLEQIFKSIQKNAIIFSEVEFHFIGTGKIPNDPESYSIKKMAEQYNLWHTIVYEYPQRIPYLDVLVHLNNANGIFILGSVEPHYTPSKVYQGILAGKAILSVLHEKSSAAKIIVEANAGTLLTFNGAGDMDVIQQKFLASWMQFRLLLETFNPRDVNLDAFNNYSAQSVTKQLADLLDNVTKKN
jgi:hypothetical protein